jgi:hypothetical protein
MGFLKSTNERFGDATIGLRQWLLQPVRYACTDSERVVASGAVALRTRLKEADVNP